MKLTIEVEVPETLLRQVASEAVEASFSPPKWRGDTGGAAYAELVKRTAEALAAIDLETILRERIATRLDTELNPIVDEIISKAVKAKVREMEKNGNLWPKKGEGEPR